MFEEKSVSRYDLFWELVLEVTFSADPKGVKNTVESQFNQHLVSMPSTGPRWEDVPKQNYKVLEVEYIGNGAWCTLEYGLKINIGGYKVQTGDVITVYSNGPYCRNDGTDLNGVPIFRNLSWYVGRS